MNATPAFNPGYRLRHDAVRRATVVLAPERLLTLNETGVAVLELVDGKRTVSDIVEALAARFTAPVEVIGPDVEALLRGLRDDGVIHL